MAVEPVQDAHMQAIIDGIKARMAKRQEAIDENSRKNERVADQGIVEDLRNAAAACPPQYPEAKQNFESMATQYEQSKSRDERDNIIFNLATKAARHNAIQMLLAAVAGLGIKAVAPEATMTLSDGETTDGYSVEHDNGTHDFLYDTNGDRIPDHKVLVDDETNEELSEPESMGLEERITEFIDIISNFF